MKKWILSLIVIAGVISIFIYNAKSEKYINIGAILPLTGPAGKYGEDARLGIEMAIDEFNSNDNINGKKVKVIFEDDQSLPQQSVSAFKKLITFNKVSIVIGGMTSSSALAIAPLAEQNKIVLISPSASSPLLSKAGDFIFRNELSDAYGGTAQAELTKNRLKISNVAILYINNDYGIGVKDAFIEKFTELGGKTLKTEAFEPNAQDFRTQLIKIKETSPQAIFIVGYKEIILILRQIRELGIKAKILSTPVFEDREILEKAKELAEGVIYVYYGGFDPNVKSKEVTEFVESFKKKYNREPGYYSALAYDATKISLYAIKKAGSTDSIKIKEILYQIKDFPGVTGSTTFDSNGDVIKPVILKTVKNGKFINLYE